MLGLLELGIVGQDVTLDLLFALNQLVFGRDILLRELIQLDTTVLILVKFVEKLVYNLLTMLIINTLSMQESVHFMSINFSIAVCVDLSEFFCETLLFAHFRIA